MTNVNVMAIYITWALRIRMMITDIDVVNINLLSYYISDTASQISHYKYITTT